jgi:hypothetical protein
MSTRDATIREHVQGAAPLISRTLYSPTPEKRTAGNGRRFVFGSTVS